MSTTSTTMHKRPKYFPLCFTPHAYLSSPFLSRPAASALHTRHRLCIRSHTTSYTLFRSLRASADDAAPDSTDAPTPVPSPPPPASAAATPPNPPAPADPSDDSNINEALFELEVPGKIVLSPAELAEQKAALEEYAEILRKDRLRTEREKARLFGFVPFAETLNGRFAMFFFVTGVLTEYWTDYTIPEQIELLLRTLGVI